MASNTATKRSITTDSSSRRTADEKAKAALDERDEKSIIKLLKDAGVKSYEPRVVSQLVERMRRYTTEILWDTRDYADHAGRVDIAMDDVRLAVRKKQDILSAGPPARDDLIRQADEVNRKPLPLIPDVFGVRLPPPQYQNTLPNLQWEAEHESLPTPQSETEQMDVEATSQHGSRNKKKPKLGAKSTKKDPFQTFGALTFSEKHKAEREKAAKTNKKKSKQAKPAQHARG
ncbi:unnamed protein product [Sphacelaria rigidula]